MWQPADNTGTPERLTKPEPGATHIPEAWHPTAGVLLFTTLKSGEATLWSLILSNRNASALGGIKSNLVIGAVVLPDGRWIAYSSNETGANRAYVQPFPPTGAKYQVFAKDTWKAATTSSGRQTARSCSTTLVPAATRL